METILLRAPGALYQQLDDGRIRNLYTVKVLNKTARDMQIEFKIENLPGEVRIMGAPEFQVRKDNLAQTSLLIEMEKSALTAASTKLRIGVYSNNKRLETVKTVFAGPRNNSISR